ncbi:hypothetical protein JCM8097_004691 [Rhodosporidiobolus ruineniae]
MSFAALPPELKQHIFGYTQRNDVLYRLKTGRHLPPVDYSRSAPWTAWLGRGALALASLDKDCRQAFFPPIVNPLKIGRLDINTLDECLSSAVGESCESAVLSIPDCILDRDLCDEIGLDEYGDDDEEAEDYWVLNYVLDCLSASLDNLEKLEIESSVADNLARLLGPEDAPRPEWDGGDYSDPDDYDSFDEDDEDDYYSAPRRSFGRPVPQQNQPPQKSIKQCLLEGGRPAFVRLAGSVKSWVVPEDSEATKDLLAGILAVSPDLRDLVLKPSGWLRGEPVFARPHPDLAASLAGCTKLESLEFSSRSYGISGSGPPEYRSIPDPHVADSWLTALATRPPPLSRLTIHSDGFDSSLAAFIGTFPTLQHLELDTGSSHPLSSGYTSLLFTSQNPPEVSPTRALPSVTTLTLTAQSSITVVELFQLVSLPDLSDLSLKLRDPLPPQTSIDTLVKHLGSAVPSLVPLRLLPSKEGFRWSPVNYRELRDKLASVAPMVQLSANWSNADVDPPAKPIPALTAPRGVADPTRPAQLVQPRLAAGQQRQPIQAAQLRQPDADEEAQALIEWTAKKLREAKAKKDDGMARMVLASLSEVRKLKKELGG